MKFGNNEVLDLSIFTEEGNLVTKLDSLKNSSVIITETGRGYIFIKDALLDQRFLEFLGKVERNEVSDFDKQLNREAHTTTITFNKKLNKKCRLIGKGLLINPEDCSNKIFTIEVPNATTGKAFELTKEYDYSSEFDFVFTINPFNDDGDLFKLHI
jgi:hypothetical protein